MADTDLLSAEFARKHPDAFAKTLAQGTAAEVTTILASLPVSSASAVAARLPASRVRAILAADPAAVECWLTEGPVDDARKLFGHIPRANCLSMVNAMRDRDRRRKFLQYLNYPAHSLGSLVRDVPVQFQSDMPAIDVIAELRAIGDELPGFIAIIGPDGQYLGAPDLWRLLVTPAQNSTISRYIRPTPTLRPEITQVSAAESSHWHTNNWLPVVDQHEHLLGAVSRASVFSAARKREEHVSSGDDLFGTLVRDAVLLLGEVLEWAFGRRGRS